MKFMLNQLWRDERGVITSAEIVLTSAILLLGTIVGLVTLRDQVVQELGDSALAVGKFNQSYSYSAVNLPQFGVTVAGSSYTDLTDFCQADPVAGEPPACISVTAAPGEEGN